MRDNKPYFYINEYGFYLINGIKDKKNDEISRRRDYRPRVKIPQDLNYILIINNFKEKNIK